MEPENIKSIEQQQLISNLSPTLFWDVDRDTIDTEKHAPYIVQRVVSMGTWEDFKLIKAFYGMPGLREIVTNLRYLDDRVLHFCSAYFDVPITEFRCYTQKQLNRPSWNY